MVIRLLLLVGCMILTLTACRGGRTSSPVTPTARPTTDVVTDFAPGQSIPAVFELQIDLATLSATSTPLVSRSGAGFQAAQYDLDITKFQTAAQFNVRSVEFTPQGDVQITFRHAHPWEAVDLNAPPSATNRADLGYTGRLLVLADVTPDDLPTHTFFGDVVANTELLRGADGFVQPGDLLAKNGFLANCFPYMLLADEAKDNRIGVSNNNVVTGNWDPAVGGWQRSNLGPNGDGWTGYDFVHAGQTIENSFVLNRDELTDGPITLQVALLIKYTEPKGQGGEAGRALRLPPETVDVLQFAYRAPHAALDCSQMLTQVIYTDRWGSLLRDTATTQLEGESGATSLIGYRLRDWDAASATSPDLDLALDAAIERVQPGTSGVPLVEIDCPTISAVPAASLAAEDPTGSGLPRDWMHLSGLLVNATGATTAGARFRDVTGLARCTDPQTALDPQTAFHRGLDPSTLTADAGRALAPVTYQALTVRLVEPAPAWNVYELDASGENGYHVAIGVIPDAAGPGQNRLAAAYLQNFELMYAQAMTIEPDGPEDWVIYKIPSPDTGSARLQGGRVRFFEQDGRPMLVFVGGQRPGQPTLSCTVRLARAASSLPLSPADWTTSYVMQGIPSEEGGGEGFDQATQCSIAIDPTGRLVVTCGTSEPTDDSLWYLRAKVDDPQDVADWDAHQVVAKTVATVGTSGYLLMTDGGPQILVPAESSGISVSRLFIATSPTPASINDWTVELVPEEVVGSGGGVFGTSSGQLGPAALSPAGEAWFTTRYQLQQLVGSNWRSAPATEASPPSDKVFFQTLLERDGFPVLVQKRDFNSGHSVGIYDLYVSLGLVPYPRDFDDYQRVLVAEDLAESALDATIYLDRYVCIFRGRNEHAHPHIAYNLEEW